MTYFGGSVEIRYGSTASSQAAACRFDFACADLWASGLGGNSAETPCSVATISAQARKNLSAFFRPMAWPSAWHPVLIRYKEAFGDGNAASSASWIVSGTQQPRTDATLVSAEASFVSSAQLLDGDSSVTLDRRNPLSSWGNKGINQSLRRVAAGMRHVERLSVSQPQRALDGLGQDRAA